MVRVGLGWVAEMDTTYSWPVLRMTSLMLFLDANAIPFAMSDGPVTLIA